jgi:hypothetical protein
MHIHGIDADEHSHRDSAGWQIAGTDLDIAVSTEVLADVEAPGAMTIPAKLDAGRRKEGSVLVSGTSDRGTRDCTGHESIEEAVSGAVSEATSAP